MCSMPRDIKDHRLQSKAKKEQLTGRRKRHFNLFQYLIIIVGIVTFLIAKTDFFDNTLKNLNAVGNAKLSIRQAQVQQDAMQLFQK